MIATALEQSFIDLCAEHDLEVIEIGLNLRQAERSRFGVTVHWDGFSSDGITCANAHGESLLKALSRALTRAKADRQIPAVAVTLPDEPLPSIAA